MNPATVLTAFREELIAAGLVRRPTTAGPTTGPPFPMLIEPAEGAPAPGELTDEDHDHDELVVSIKLGGGVAPTTPYDAVVRRVPIIDVRYRAVGGAGLRLAYSLDNAIRGRLFRPETNYGVGFVMGSASPVNVHQASVWAELSPISRGRGVASDDVAKYAIEVAGV